MSNFAWKSAERPFAGIRDPRSSAVHIPRKRFSQNFLEDRAVVDHIVDAIHPRHGERMVEIGPGLGALTAPLLEALDRLAVVEIDRDAVRSLQSRFPRERLAIYQGDVLEFDFAALGNELRVVGNLPYNISTPILFHLTGFAASIRDGHFMLQREVVERMGAGPGQPAYGRLSVMIQQKWRVEPLFDVPPTAFHPQPKVWSSIVRMTPLPAADMPGPVERRFAEVVTAAFGQRRKTMRNAMRQLLEQHELEALGIDPGARGETLGIPEFLRIAEFLEKRGD